MNNDNQLDKEPITIFKGGIARLLLRKGYRLVDILPQKLSDGTMDYTRSCFLFADENDIRLELDKIFRQQREKKQNQRE